MLSAPDRARSRRAHSAGPVVALASGGAALLLVAGAIAPVPAFADDGLPHRSVGGQSLDIIETAAPAVSRPRAYDSEKSPAEQKADLIAAHDNYAWAKLVLWYGGWPITEQSVTVMVRWMRQENGVNSWWNRNNPLNNGWGVGSYMNTVENLDTAAYYVADAIHSLGGYASIREAFASGALSADEIWTGIWTSSWASGHYDGGTHYSTAPVPSVVAPADAWG